MVIWVREHQGPSGRIERVAETLYLRIYLILNVAEDRREFVRLMGVGVTAVIAALGASKLQKSLPKAASGGEIVKLAKFPVGSTMQYTAPDGNPAYLFRTAAGVFAYSAICTHQGCVVSYNSLSKTLNCPCHGGRFDPYNGGAVLGGPPPTPLPKYTVAIKGDAIVNA